MVKPKLLDQVRDATRVRHLSYIGFKIKILGRLEGGRRTRRTLTTDNASKIFILKSIERSRPMWTGSRGSSCFMTSVTPVRWINLMSVNSSPNLDRYGLICRA